MKKAGNSGSLATSKLLTTLTLLAISGLLFISAREFERLWDANFLSELRIQETVKLVEVREDMEEHVFEHFLRLQKITSFIEENPGFSTSEFEDRVAPLVSESPDIVNVGAAPDLVVRHIFPRQGNEAAIGLDYRNTPTQLSGVMHAIETRSAVLVGPVDIVQGGKALIFRQPAFVGDGTTEEKTLWGIVSILVDYDAFIQNTGLSDYSSEFDLLIRTDQPSGTANGVFYGRPQVQHENPVVLEFDFPNGDWEIMSTPAGGWPLHSPDHLRNRILMAGAAAVFLSAILTILVLSGLQRRSQIRLSGAVNAMDDGFAMFDADGKLVAFNSKYAEIYDTTSDIIKHGASFEDIIRSGAERGQLVDAIGQEEDWVQDRLARFYGDDVDFEQELSNGRYILASDRRMEDGGRVCVRTDVTQLKQATRKAEAANRAKSEFISMLSHELLTPLSVILGLTGLAKEVRHTREAQALNAELEKEPADLDKIREATANLAGYYAHNMETLEKSAKHLHGLVNDMLDMAKVDSGTFAVMPAPRDIDSIVSSVDDLSRQKAEEKGLAFETVSSGGSVFCDQLRTTQILLNLVGNAIKFTPSGRVTLETFTRGDDVVFEVSDTGPGIRAEDLERVFDAFEQLDASDTRTHGGIGLGLAISRRLAEAQDGALTVESKPGQGSKFTLTLPRQPRNSGRTGKAAQG